MWKRIQNYFQGGAEARRVASSVNESVISGAYNSVAREIESLSAYDRGEKNIDAPSLRDTVRRIQRAS